MTLEQLTQILPKVESPRDWFIALSAALPKHKINTTNRIAAFMSQCSHESLGFTVLEENLNYSGNRLRAVFGKYFATNKIAAEFERQPEKIANRVYSNRMGNGDEESGEGWKYRGRGILQITGKNNYRACSIELFADETVLLDYPELLATKHRFMVESACWYWTKNNLNQYADSEDLETLTRKINGGINGLQDRIEKYHSFKQILESK